MTLDEWKDKNRKGRGYAHFDAKVSLKSVWNYISNPQKVASHSFYPFIHFAKEVFDFVRECNDCYVIVGDFTKFFDRLDHKYLKRMLCSLLDVSTLPDDYYAVFKNITRYTKWDMESILQLNRLDNTRAGYQELNHKDIALTPEQFQQYKKECIKRPEEKGCGIPQGSAISAVLSNIYMLDFDKKIYSLIQPVGGMYRRYSDDFILILPATCDCRTLIDAVFSCVKEIPRLDLQPDKTRVYRYENSTLININSQILSAIPDSPNILNYLGFSFDGRIVTIRDKTISKYYYRMNRKLKTIVAAKGRTKDGKRISCKNLYEKYTVKGAHSKQGNFITYVERAKKVFGDNEAIDRSTKTHMQKIRKKLNNIKN